MVYGWTYEEIAWLTLPRVWGIYKLWAKNPPMHRLFAMFVGYSQGESSAPSRNKGFEITPGMLQAFGGRNRQVCRQSQLPPQMRKTLDEFHSTPAYKNFRSKLDGKVKHGRS